MTRTHSRTNILFIVLLVMLTGLACQITSISLAPEESPSPAEWQSQLQATIEAGDFAARDETEPAPTAIPEIDATDAPLPPAVETMSLSLEQTLVELYRDLNPAVVHIFVFDFETIRGNEIRIPLGTGSGFVYDSEGHIVTNNHVVEGGTALEVAFANGERRRATIIGKDTDSDLAVIKVDSLPAGVNPIPVGDSDLIEVGQFVVAIGNPFGEAGSMSVGVISGLGRTLPTQRTADGGGRYSIPQVIQTDAAINPGNSGGPLLNLRGEVVGVNSAILTRTGTNTGVGFSVPSKAVSLVVPELIAHGEYIYPFMGISMYDDLTLDELDELVLTSNGIYVTAVVPNTPAAEAGLIGCCTTGGNTLRPGGDYITAVNGQPLMDSAQLISYLVFETKVGDTIDLTVIRNGEELIVPLTLAPRP